MPYVFALPGYGLGIRLNPDVFEAYPIEGGGIDRMIEAAIRFASEKFSGTDDPALTVWNRWAALTATAQPTVGNLPTEVNWTECEQLCATPQGLRIPGKSLRRDACSQFKLPSKEAAWSAERLTCQSGVHVAARTLHDGQIVEGRGDTIQAASLGALGEAIERHVAGCQPRIRQTGTRRQIGNSVLPPIGVFDLFHDDLEVDWIPVKDVHRSTIHQVPAEIAFRGYVPTRGIRAFGYDSTHGLATGTTQTEALANALLEIMERDAYWTVMRCHLSTQTVQSEFRNASVRQSMELLQRDGRAIHLKWISLDWPVPIVHALIESVDGSVPALAHGTGASLDPLMAVQRATEECVQSLYQQTRFCDLYGDRISEADSFSTNNPHYLWCHPSHRKRVAFLKESTPAHVIGTSSLVPHPTTLRTAIKELAAKGHSCFASTLHGSDGLAVVKAVIPTAQPPVPDASIAVARLESLRMALKLPSLYNDPILL